MRILHTGDLHLDGAFCAYGKKDADKQRAASRELLRRVFDCAKIERCEMILIAGDLFDTGFVSPESARLFEKLVTENNIHVVISPGNHDFYIEGGFYSKIRERLADKLTVFTSNELQVFDFDKLKVRVFGYAFTAMALAHSPLSDVRMPEDNGYLKLLCAHADLASPISRYAPITLPQINSCGFDYVALGHIHNRAEKEDEEGRIRYCGFAEGRSFDEIGRGGVWIVDFAEDGSISCERKMLSKRAFYIDSIDLGDAFDAKTAIIAVKQRLERFSGQEGVCLRLTLEGRADEEAVRSIYERSDSLCLEYSIERLEITDATLPYLDGEYLERDTTIRGELYRTLLPKLVSEDSAQRALAAKALRIGLAAIDGKSVSAEAERG